MMPKTEISGDGEAEEWSTPVNWEDPVIQAEQNGEDALTIPIYCLVATISMT